MKNYFNLVGEDLRANAEELELEQKLLQIKEENRMLKKKQQEEMWNGFERRLRRLEGAVFGEYDDGR